MDIDQLKEPDFVPHVSIQIAGYEVNDKGIFKISVKRTADGDNAIVTPLSYMPLSIHTRLTNPDSGEVFYEVEFENKKVIISGTDISQKKGIMQLAGHGLLTTEKYASDLSEYIVRLISMSHLPEARIYDRMGWKNDGFVLGQTLLKEDNTQDKVTLAGAGIQANAIKQSGTMKGWIKAVEGLMKYDTQRFKMYVAIIPPLLDIIKESNFSVNDYGETSTGKTITTLVAMSVYGEPYELSFSGDTTKVGVERTASQFCDIPINLDDIQTIKKEVLDNLVYMIANGVGKIRGAKSGGLQEVLTWRTVGLFTGEVPIITESTFQGMDARLLELYGGLQAIAVTEVKQFEDGIRENYGVFAPVLIRYILNNKQDILTIHKNSILVLQECRNNLNLDKLKNGIANRLADIFASILTAGTIFELLFSQEGGTSRDAKSVVTKLYTECIVGKASEGYMIKGLSFVLSWIASNRSNFLENNERTIAYTKHKDDYNNEKSSIYTQKYKIFGNITSEYYEVLSSELRTELKKHDINPDRLIKELAMNNILRTDVDRLVKTVRIEGQPVRVYQIIRSKLEGLGFKEINEGE